MPTVKGRTATRRFIESLPSKLEKGILRGAAKAGGTVVMDEAKDTVTSKLVAPNLRLKVTSADDKIVARIYIAKGWPRSVGTWLELGTSSHYISVDDSQRSGKSVRRINDQAKDGVLTINGQPVGKTVFHPGARPHPWLYPALDMKEREAIAAAQGYINARVRKSGLLTDSED